MFCVQCGTELPEQAKFCMECGTRVGESGEKLFKVTFDRDSWGPIVSPPFRLVIDQKQRETIENGQLLDVYMTKGEHEIEISFAGKVRYSGVVVIDVDTVLGIKEDILWGTLEVSILK